MIEMFRRSVPRFRIAVLVTAILATSAAPALAHSAVDGPEREFGEMVDYPLVHPVAGDFTLPFDSFYSGRADGIHHAQDLMADKMTPVVAVADGTIERVNWSRNPDDLNPSRCCTIVLDHDDGWESWYIHLNNDTPGTDDGAGWGIAPGILPGARVAAGDLLGWVGDSGNAEGTSPHLHYELRDPNGTIVNPYESLLAAAGVEIDATQTGSTGGSASGSGGSTTTAATMCTLPDDTGVLLDGTAVLRRGSRGDAVEVLQALLNALGFDAGTPDGVFGARTEGALRGFQDEQGITVDGLAGGETRTALRSLVTTMSHASVLYPGPPLRPGDRGEAVSDLQVLLKVAGYDPQGADGFYGPKTEAAVRRLQRQHDIDVDGKVGPQTRGVLIEILGLDTLIGACS